MKILPKLEVNVDGYNDENQETVPMAMFDKTVGELLAETDKVNQLTAENAKLRAQLAEAVAALHTLNDEMSVVAYSGFDPERWGERIGALDAAGRVLAKHTAASTFDACLSRAIDRIHAELDTCTDRRRRRWLRRRLRVLERRIP